MKAELLFLCGGAFACASGLFAIANSSLKGGNEYDAGVLICAIVAIAFLASGIDQVRRGLKGGP